MAFERLEDCKRSDVVNRKKFGTPSGNPTFRPPLSSREARNLAGDFCVAKPVQKLDIPPMNYKYLAYATALAPCIASCGSTPSTNQPGLDAGDTAGEQRPTDPADPVASVASHAGPYGFAKLTTDRSNGLRSSGIWFTSDRDDRRLSEEYEPSYSRYRDDVLMQSDSDARVWLYDQRNEKISAEINLPTDAVGRAAIRGGFIYAGGLSKVYSYEIATKIWRTRDLPTEGTCHHASAGQNRLFVMCQSPTGGSRFFSMFANKTMSDVVDVGAVDTEGQADSNWLTASPANDVAYFRSTKPTRDCIGRMTSTSIEECFIAGGTSIPVNDASVSDDGMHLYVKLYTSDREEPDMLSEVRLSDKNVKQLTNVESYATCPDNSVIMQSFITSKRYAGGVFSDVRPGSGGQRDMACPLKPL
jgi:hypothetical protein